MSVETLLCIGGKLHQDGVHHWVAGTVHRFCSWCGYVQFAFTMPPNLPMDADPEWAWYWTGPTAAPI